jgi:hypothetical protein
MVSVFPIKYDYHKFLQMELFLPLFLQKSLITQNNKQNTKQYDMESKNFHTYMSRISAGYGMFRLKAIETLKVGPGTVVHTCNSSYLGDGDKRIKV